jgi:hypothetical protein
MKWHVDFVRTKWSFSQNDRRILYIINCNALNLLCWRGFVTVLLRSQKNRPWTLFIVCNVGDIIWLGYNKYIAPRPTFSFLVPNDFGTCDKIMYRTFVFSYSNHDDTYNETNTKSYKIQKSNNSRSNIVPSLGDSCESYFRIRIPQMRLPIVRPYQPCNNY